MDKLDSKEYSYRFDELRQNRIAMGLFKYGSAKVNFGNRLVDARGCIDRCLKKFDETHNTEYLLDAANYCMFRYMYPHEGEFFKATDSSESAGIDGISHNELKAQ